MVLRKSRSVWSEIPPWTIRIFPSMTVATGRRLKTSWNSWRISRPWVCKQPQSHSDNRSLWASEHKKSRIKTCACTLYFCMTSFVNPYLKQQHKDITMACCSFNTLMFAWWFNISVTSLLSPTWGSLCGLHGSLGSGACSRGKVEGRRTGARPLQSTFSHGPQSPR